MVERALFSSDSDEWATPKELFESLNREYSFTLDACATKDNTKLPKFYTLDDDGLTKDWGGETVWCNPPYSEIGAWVKKCSENRCVMLVPARTDTRYWHEHVFPKACAILFIKGRLKFGNAKSSAPFPSALIFFNINPKDTLELKGRLIRL